MTDSRSLPERIVETIKQTSLEFQENEIQRLLDAEPAAGFIITFGDGGRTPMRLDTLARPLAETFAATMGGTLVKLIACPVKPCPPLDSKEGEGLNIPTEFHKRLKDFEAIDRIEFQIVPRYKTSGLSGDEWRQHVEVVGYFKGLEVLRFGASRVEVAAALLPAKIIEWGDEGVGNEFLERERATCDQPSCSEPFTTVYRLKRLTASNGEYLDPAEQFGTNTRKFCAKHSRRGDCSREDADDNYELVSGPPAGAVDPAVVSPSGQVAVNVGSIETLPQALREITDQLKGEPS